MPVNSIPPSQHSQPTQAAQDAKRSDAVAARKQANTQESNKVNDRKDAAERQAQLQKAQEQSKPSVNTSGQKVGTRINVSA
jgi:hypothetical protein